MLTNGPVICLGSSAHRVAEEGRKLPMDLNAVISAAFPEYDSASFYALAALLCTVYRSVYARFFFDAVTIRNFCFPFFV